MGPGCVKTPSLEPCQGSGLVRFHHSRIANNIGREDRGEPALDALFGHAAASFKTREDGQFYVGKWAESNDLECLLCGSQAVIPNTVRNVRSWVISGSQFREA